MASVYDLMGQLNPQAYSALSGAAMAPGDFSSYGQQCEQDRYHIIQLQQQMQSPLSSVPGLSMPTKRSSTFREELQEETNEWLKNTI